jgi:DNA-binding transcriptional MocR family regulator
MGSNHASLNRTSSSADQQFRAVIEKEILSQISPGSLLPSVRQLVDRYRVSPVTVTRALKALSLEGLVITKPGAGTFAAQPPKQSYSQVATMLDTSWQSLALGARAPLGEESTLLLGQPRADVLPLGSGYPDERLQPLALLERATARAARHPGAWGRASVAGFDDLRTWFAQSLGGHYTGQDALIAPGGQAAVACALRALVPPGGTVLMESPTYFGALAVARSSGYTMAPVPIDAHGVRPEWLEQALQNSGARVVYLQPTHQNPSGAVLAPERRRAVLEIAAKYNAFVIEDDYARDFTMDGIAPPPLALEDEAGRVVYIRSLTKCSAPSLRIAVIMAKGPVRERLRAQLAISEMFTSSLHQLIALELVTSPGWTKHLRGLREALSARRDTLIKALEKHWPEARVPLTPSGGFCLWLELPFEQPDFANAALQAGVHVASGGAWFPAEPSGAHLRLSYAAADHTQLIDGAKILSSVWREQR